MSTENAPATPGRWWAMATLSMGVALVVMDATVVNVALPVVIEDLGLDASGAQWMNAVYSLVFASLMLTSGRLGDVYGRRRAYSVGLTAFMVASILAGAAWSPAVLIGARFLQGMGAALVLPSTLSTLNAMFTGKERSIAFAIWGSTIGGMAAVGPLVGGWLATDVSWRWAFWLNIPCGLLTLVGIRKHLVETRDPDLPKGTDMLGVPLSALGIGGIVFALIEGQAYGWWLQDSGDLSPVPVSLVLGVILLATFVVVERRRAAAGKVVLIDLGLLRIKSFRFGVVAALVVAMGEFGLLFTLPLLLQGALGYTALGTGVIVLALALGTFLISAATPQLAAKLGQRGVVRLGLSLEALAVGGLAVTLSSSISSWAIAAWLFVYGLGVGLATAQLTSVILVGVPVAESGQASGFQTTVRQLGSALGVAVLGTVLITVLTTSTGDRLDEAGTAAAQRDQAVTIVHQSAGAGIPLLLADPATEAAGQAAADAMIHASKWATGLAAGVLVLGLAATLALPALPADSEGRSTGSRMERAGGRRPTP
ncbi:MFS transporter [Cellulomonas sp. KRMCY2]|uniref:MFS transporter n=1 Tax=Cellulomonas sp. KRMCY2 TaxID=1304865 RepID=UPI00045E7FC4|nr:MFS transporter [Cellulomonas sp. KRMCY2]